MRYLRARKQTQYLKLRRNVQCSKLWRYAQSRKPRHQRRRARSRKQALRQNFAERIYGELPIHIGLANRAENQCPAARQTQANGVWHVAARQLQASEARRARDTG